LISVEAATEEALDRVHAQRSELTLFDWYGDIDNADGVCWNLELMRDSMLEWFGQPLIASDYDRDLNDFGLRVLQPTLDKWRSL
jgi:hypothetical protein